ncbi:MAG: 16S rRNA (uracil(1498)-N(3))-methyltransferase [Alphaproteobacteria bacterium]|nr:16S rRNA (uracil(1498)-N(3))-methyltransferase [Alphaproteobacteria bacterium]
MESENFKLPDSQVNHVGRVLRMREGDEFLAYNKATGEWLCRIKKIHKCCITATRICCKRKYVEFRRIALGICQIKPENMKLVIEKCTELGATDFYMLDSEYTNYNNNIEKLRRIAILASEQSERLDIPTIQDPTQIAHFAKDLPMEYTWYTAIERAHNGKNALEIAERNVGFIIGPEGGFSVTEREILCQKTTPISLSRNILRSETAAILCTAIAGML